MNKNSNEFDNLNSFSDAEPYHDDLSNFSNEMTPIKIDNSSCGKAILIGEHAVIYGATAVAMPLLSKRVHINLTPRLQTTDLSINIYLGGQCVTEHIKDVVLEAFALLEIEPFSLDIEGVSSLPIGAGLGSSAALCVVILKALSASLGRPLPLGKLAMLSNRLEERFHGRPSGLDTAVVASECVISFSKDEGLKPITFGGNRPLEFLVIDTGEKSSTLSMVKTSEKHFAGPDGAYLKSSFQALAEQAISALEGGNENQLAAAMNQTNIMLGEIGLLNEALHKITKAALHAGALAAKMTGAGGGGCALILLDPDRDDTLRILKQQFRNDIYKVELS